MRLWTVVVKSELMVLAADKDAAKLLAKQATKDEDFFASVVLPRAVASVRDIPEEWRDAIPWSEGVEDDQRTCAEWQASFEEAARRLPLPGTETP